jgi:DNA-binding NarL/FixJ family response regulator
VAASAPAKRSPLSELTPRDQEVLAQIAEWTSNAAIAESLFLTKRAVEHRRDFGASSLLGRAEYD